MRFEDRHVLDRETCWQDVLLSRTSRIPIGRVTYTESAVRTARSSSSSTWWT